MLTLLQFVMVLAVFFPVSYLAYYLTEVRGLPEWLQYKPWVCRTCLTFWMLIGIYVAIWVSFSCLYTGVIGIALACMNAAAMYIDQKNRTIKV